MKTGKNSFNLFEYFTMLHDIISFKSLKINHSHENHAFLHAQGVLGLKNFVLFQNFSIQIEKYEKNNR